MPPFITVRQTKITETNNCLHLDLFSRFCLCGKGHTLSVYLRLAAHVQTVNAGVFVRWWMRVLSERVIGAGGVGAERSETNAVLCSPGDCSVVRPHTDAAQLMVTSHFMFPHRVVGHDSITGLAFLEVTHINAVISHHNMIFKSQLVTTHVPDSTKRCDSLSVNDVMCNLVECSQISQDELALRVSVEDDSWLLPHQTLPKCCLNSLSNSHFCVI